LAVRADDVTTDGGAKMATEGMLDPGAKTLAPSAACACVNLWSAYRRKRSPSTGTEYSDAFSFEFARSSSAASHSLFSISLMFRAIESAHSSA